MFNHTSQSVNLETNEVYHSIYMERYSLSENHVKEASNYINKNLSQLRALGFAHENLNILTVGTGREVKAWSNIDACKSIQHFDISPEATEAVASIDCKDTNITSDIFDLCSDVETATSNYSSSIPVNLIYLSGVYHHLQSPFQALKNLCQFAGEECWFLFRVYRAGTARWGLVSWLRENANTASPDQVIDVAKGVFTNLNFGNILVNAPAYILENYIDNVLVPNCHLFDPILMSSWLSQFGFSIKEWTDPSSLGPLGHFGESVVANGSTVIFKSDDFKDTKNLLAKSQLSEHPPSEILQSWPVGKFADDVFVLRLKEIGNVFGKLSTERQIALGLVMTCLIEAPYIKKRFDQTPIFKEAILAEYYNTMTSAAGDDFLHMFCDVIEGVIEHEIR